jgi:hypothetical protein
VNPPAPEPFTQKNHYAELPAMDLSAAVFEERVKLDPQKLEAVLTQVRNLTNSNIEDAAKWTAYLQLIDTTLRSTGLVLQIASVA